MSTQPDLIQAAATQPPPLEAARIRLAKAYEAEHDAEISMDEDPLIDAPLIAARRERIAAQCAVERYEAAELARRKA